MDNLSFLEHPKLNGKVAILGVPLDLGKDAVGTEAGPATLRKLGLGKMLDGIGLEVVDLGDVSCPEKISAAIGNKKAKYLEPIVEVSERVAVVVERAMRNGQKVLAIGGDNTVSIGTVSGCAAGLDDELGVIWIDAHGDINTSDTTLSGNIHGMPISALLGMGEPRLTNLHRAGSKIKPENLLYIGLKDLDQAEIDLIRKNNIAAVTMVDIAENSLRPAFEAIKNLTKKVKHVWVCLDIDSVDAADAPGTPMATRGGLSYRESVNLARFIGKICPVVGVDVTEFAPHLDREVKTALLIMELVAGYFGSEYNWYTAYMQEEAKKQQLAGSEMGVEIDFSSKK